MKTLYPTYECETNHIPVFSPGFFEGIVGGGAGIRARRWEKGRKERKKSSRKGKKKGNKKNEWNGKGIGERKKEGRQGES